MASIQRPPAWNLGFLGCAACSEGKRWRGSFVRLSRRGDGAEREQVEAAALGKKQRSGRPCDGDERGIVSPFPWQAGPGGRGTGGAAG